MYHQNPSVRIAISEEIARLEAMQEMGDYTNGLDADVIYSESGAAFRLAKLRALLAEFDGLPVVAIPTTKTIEPDPRDEELAALRARVAELEMAPPAPVDEPPPLSPHPDELMSDYGPVGEDAITGDMLLDAFEADAVETAAVVKTLSATRLKHLSEQLNVTRAALDREHSATGIANPRSAAIDRLLNLLIRRGEV